MRELTEAIRERRVAVALDVLDQIRLTHLRVEPGYYVRLHTDEILDDKLLPELTAAHERGADLREVVDTLTPYCGVCARGAMLLSKARCFDAIPLNRLMESDGYRRPIHQEDTTKLLADTFDEATLDRIEVAFELTNPNDDNDYDDETYEDHARAYAFGYRVGRDYILDAEARLIAVMNNLVANRGEFKPEQTPDTRLPEIIPCPA